MKKKPISPNKELINRSEEGANIIEELKKKIREIRRGIQRRAAKREAELSAAKREAAKRKATLKDAKKDPPQQKI